MRTRPLDQRFWSKVDRSGGPDACWLWSGSRCGNGYGQIIVNGKLRAAHQVAWELTIGMIPAGLWVLHHCDVRNCVRPEHLFLGTRKDNTRDMLEKGRSVRGDRNGMAKLTPSDVRRIFSLRASGWTQQRIADELGVRQPAISDILRGRRWRGFEGGRVEVRP